MVEGVGFLGSDVIYLGIFDILMMSNIFNLVYLVLINKEEVIVMIDWVFE